MNIRKAFIVISILTVVTIGCVSYFWISFLWSFVLFGPLILIGFYDLLQKKHTLKSNFPLVANLRYMLETLRPGIMQYFVETDTQGRPINRMFRTLIYQRSKKVNSTVPS